MFDVAVVAGLLPLTTVDQERSSSGSVSCLESLLAPSIGCELYLFFPPLPLPTSLAIFEADV